MHRLKSALILLSMSASQSSPARASEIAAPTAVEAIAMNPKEIRVYWNRAAGASRYVIRRDGIEICSAAAGESSFTDSRIEAGRTYRYEVASVGAFGETAVGNPYVERSYADLPPVSDCDVLVVGATTAGVAAAATSARYGLRVVLIEETRRLGGMPVNGLGSTDLRRLANSSGLFEEFRRRVQSIYGSGDGLRYEPRVAHQAMKEMLWAEPSLTVHRQVRPVGVSVHDGRIESVLAERVSDGQRVTFRPRVVVDATECGDVAAWAGARFRVGRESRSTREPHAGHIFYDRAGDKPLPGSTGRGDARVQAYAYLMTVKDFGSGADRTIPKPPGYDPRKYEHATPWDKSWAVTSGKLPNGKYEVNQHPQGSDLQVINYPYPAADYAERRRIEEQFKNHALGYLYYIQTVEGKKQIGLSEDDYRDNDGWPSLLYIREARRIIAGRIIDERDISLRALQPDAIGIGDYPMDSHAAEAKTDWSTPDLGEGEFYLPQHTPWHQVPFDIMIPKGLSNLFAPTAVSATHVAYGTVRLEPTRMHFGEAAGIASYLAIRHGVEARDVPFRQIQDELLKHDTGRSGRAARDGIGAPGPSSNPALLYNFADIKPGLRKYRAIEWLAARGFFPSPPPQTPRTPANALAVSSFNPDAPIIEGEAVRLINLLAERAKGETALRADPLPAAVQIPGDAESQSRPLTRLSGARLIVAAAGWRRPGTVNLESRYADIKPGTPDSAILETLYDHWIDPRLWDPWPRYSADGRMLFAPSTPLTRAQFAEAIYFAHMYAGPLWEDFEADRMALRTDSQSGTNHRRSDRQLAPVYD